MVDTIDVMNGIKTNLSAASCLGNNVGFDFGIIDVADQWCAIIEWTDMDEAPAAYGGVKAIEAAFLINGYVRVPSDVTDALPKTACFLDLVRNSLNSDETLQGTVEMMSLTRAKRQTGLTVTVDNGQNWLPIEITLTAEWWSDQTP